MRDKLVPVDCSMITVGSLDLGPPPYHDGEELHGLGPVVAVTDCVSEMTVMRHG